MDSKIVTQAEDPASAAEVERCRVLLVDAFPLRRAGLKRLLEDWKEDSACSGFRLLVPDAVASLDDAAPVGKLSLVLFSIGASPAGSPDVLDAIRKAKQVFQPAPIVVLSDKSDAPEVIAAFAAGALGFIAGDTDPSLMFLALKFIARGGVFFPPDALLDDRERPERAGTRMLATAGPRWDSQSLILGLTARQKEVLQFLREGQSNKRIAIALGMCESTVKVHVRQIMRKLGAANRTQVALYAANLDQQEVIPVENSQPSRSSAQVMERRSIRVIHT